MGNTLIITVGMEPRYQEHFNTLRKKHFPPHANYLDAHITLFYHLPANQPIIQDALHSFATRAPITLHVTGLSLYGNGVGYQLSSQELQDLHREMQAKFDPWLIRQDRQPLRPHITIQNKVTAMKAQLLYDALKKNFMPFSFDTTGLQTWIYLKGPWKARETFPFIIP